MEEDYPGIKQQDAEIYWGDETGIRSDCQHEHGDAPKGKNSIVKLNATLTSLNMIPAISNQGTVRFQIYKGSMNADRLIDFLKRLTKKSELKVYLILDNLRVHHAQVINS
ncbi:transposase [Microbulbifer sp. VTAC004]|uniref:transposase n=1 Tax=Microbulbifer sp. VTAC004 TaxID=3243386 RepID=UPI004039A554